METRGACTALSLMETELRLQPLAAEQVRGRGPSASAPSENVYSVGMPNTSAGGLSENWMLKEAGHLHWQALGDRFGFDSQDFKDGTGRRLYAAFIALQLKNARLSMVGEGATLKIATNLTRVSKARFSSRHVVTCDDRMIAEIELISTFVARSIVSDNRSVARTDLIQDLQIDSTDDVVTPLYVLSQKFRKQQWIEHNGFFRGQPRSERTISFRPCPSNDFNGADFLYFANFQMFADRAEWEWNVDATRVSPISSREIFYAGNIDIGDRIEIVRCGSHFGRLGEKTWSRIVRVSDNKTIADVFTRRQACS
jgi:probable biosynthetic protein (TIGR04099 family)